MLKVVSVIVVFALFIGLFMRWLFAKPRCCGQAMELTISAGKTEFWQCRFCRKTINRSRPTAEEMCEAIQKAKEQQL
jgi:tRNA(Ile2) C34 agmatinyltransferase TiaS